MLKILYLVFFNNNLIKFVPTNPAPPVTIILFFSPFCFNITLNKLNQSNLGRYQEFLPTRELKKPEALQKYNLNLNLLLISK